MPAYVATALGSDGSSVQVSVVSEAAPPWTPRGTTITGASSPAYAPDTAYIDCANPPVPINAQHITVIGADVPTTKLKGVVDVDIGGHSKSQRMDAGPRSDGNDLLQIKRWPNTTAGVIPDGVILRNVYFHDVTRPVGSQLHPDGIQVMAGRNGLIVGCMFERCDVQPLFFRYAGSVDAGGGPIEDWSIDDCDILKPPNGFYALRIAGNGDAFVPTRVVARNSRIATYSIDSAAQAAGCRVIG